MALQKRHLVATIVVAFLSIQPALADKPAHAGAGGGQSKGQNQGHGNASGKPDQAKKNERSSGEARGKADRSSKPSREWQAESRSGRGYHSDRGDSVSINIHFNDQQRNYLRDYYGDEFRAGRCPPGLAKKHNGCMPPGQAKKWRIGHPLDRDVIFYDLPPTIVARIGMPPSGYRYVRVASDILMIAIGTGLVVDAVADLARM